MNTDDLTNLPLTIVGIGASAGGLEAFRSFFGAMPADSGLAFIVVLHLPQNRQSMLPEILSRWTSMPVYEAVDGDTVEPDRVYVPPPHAVTSLDGRKLRIHMPAAEAPREYRPIDALFDSLAGTLRDHAIGIVLSGTGSDGALGLKAIKECGGLTIAQGTNSDGPMYPDMPAGAISTGAVDLIAPADQIPGHLTRIQQARDQRRPVTQEMSPAELEAARVRICELLRLRLGHDFSGYKDKTFLRRVQRRMQVLGIDTVAAYIARLEADTDEVTLLFRDLLIRVTSFFRDNETFDTIERVVMPQLFDDKHADNTVRVWVPGCATGEEAYSLAILLHEQLGNGHGRPDVQVFGTDIDEPAIATARLGRYPATLLEGLSEARRDRYFTTNDHGYTIKKEIRELCTFSPHSLVRDPPFSRMDMISCRNLLIYLDSKVQDAVFPAFHYSLVPGGVLLLGSSESPARHDNLFEPIDANARIFRRRDVRSPPLSLLRNPETGARHTGGRPADDRISEPSWPSQPTQLGTHVLNSPAANGRAPDDGANAMIKSKVSSGGGLRARVHEIMRRFAPGRTEIENLRDDLITTRLQLQAVSEEHQAALEELRSANEELHSVNEELQSTNEELETSKEEIQSVNEELHTVNAQLSIKVDELDHMNSDLRNLFESTQIATVFLDKHLIVRSFTPAVSSIYNLIPSDQGRPLSDIVSRVDYSDLREDVSKVLETLEPLERRVARFDKRAHYLMRVLPYRAPDSSVSGILVTYLDVTSIVMAEQHQRLLVDELNHRVKNMLTVVISLASQSLRRAHSLEDFSTTFMGRVQALTASYTLLSRENWSSVSLHEILEEETKPYAAKDHVNVTLDGPQVRLGPSSALAIGMAIHELATNAVKYGALSLHTGVVDLSWHFEEAEDGEMFVIDWLERGGPPVSQPTRQGFGMTVIERGIAHELGGHANVRFNPEGVHATLRAPVGSSVVADKC